MKLRILKKCLEYYETRVVIDLGVAEYINIVIVLAITKSATALGLMMLINPHVWFKRKSEKQNPFGN